jgi:hypothetical protein
MGNREAQQKRAFDGCRRRSEDCVKDHGKKPRTRIVQKETRL